MENNEWDGGLKDKLENFQPDDQTPDWEAFLDYLSVHEQTTLWEQDEIFDETVKESLTGFEAADVIKGWERIDASLNLADEQFDSHIRDRVKDFHPSSERHTWPMMLSRISGTAYLRSKLIAFKVVEVAAVLLLLFTFVKMGQMGKLPFESPIFHPKETPTVDKPLDIAGYQLQFSHESSRQKESSPDNELLATADNTKRLSTANSSSPSDLKNKNQQTATQSGRNVGSQRSLNSTIGTVKQPTTPLHAAPITAITSEESNTTFLEIGSIDADLIAESSGKERDQNKNRRDVNIAAGPRIGSAMGFMASMLSPVKWSNHPQLPRPTFVKQRSKTYTEFGVFTQLDYNKLRMPEDKLISAGRQITFPQQGIASANMGGGFSFALAHPKWALETGMIYTPKKFKPGRQLIVGGAFDNGSVDFEAMRLQMVTVPFQFRYKIDSQGPWRVYAMAGAGLHLIAQADVDVVIKYHFPSLSFGGDPTKDPDLAETIRETRRISEDIRDGAPFSSKSFVSVNAGCGIEYTVTENKILFLQSVIQYQVPNLQFSNNNGKHLRTLALQAGVRTPLGK